MSAPLAQTEPKVLDGKYALLRELGSGGAGTVYEAEHLVMGKRVAVKLLNAGAAQAPDARARVVAEARAAARIAHANVVDIHDLGISAEGVPYLVMELLEGETLAELVARGPLSPSHACELVAQMLAGLSAAHRKGIIHCDLKPANVMVTHPGPGRPLVKVLDFGVARPVLESAAQESTVALGTPMYMAPEQVCGQPVDERTDVYAACAILYVLLTGTDPFTGKTTPKIMEQVARGELRPVLEAKPDLSPELAEIVEHGMRRKRKERIGSAEELAEQLARFINESGAHVLGSKARARSEQAISLRAPERALLIRDASKPPEASLLRLQVSPRIITDSILVSPRLPKAPAAPNLEVGRDFMPMLDDPARNEHAEQRSRSTQVPNRGVGSIPAVIAMVVGFGAGVILAWAAGLI
jgi:serine/threonine-protein kinase